MLIKRQDKYVELGKTEEQWCAEQTIGTDLLRYREVVWSDTKMGAITKMLIKIHGNNLAH